jgi:hypothetical protein
MLEEALGLARARAVGRLADEDLALGSDEDARGEEPLALAGHGEVRLLSGPGPREEAVRGPEVDADRDPLAAHGRKV